MNKKKQRKILEWIPMDIYRAGYLMLAVRMEYDEIIKELKTNKKFDKKIAKQWALSISEDKELIDAGSFFALRRTLENTKTGEKVTYFIIIIKQFDFKDDCYCVLAHEVLHICQFLLPKLLKRDEEREAEAYFHTYLMNRILEELRK